MLELGTVGIHPLQVLVEGEVRERFPGRLEPVDVDWVDSNRRVMTDWNIKWWLVTWCRASHLVKWQSWGFLAFLHKLFSGRPEGGKWVRAVQYKCQTKSARVGLHIKEIYEWLCHGGEWGRPPPLLGEIITTLARLKFEETFCNTLQCFVALLLGWFDVVMSTVRRCYVFIKLNERSEQQWPVVYE